MDERLFLKQFGHLAGSPEGIKKLRGFVLELASHGKLLPQEKSDTPSQKVLEQNKIKPLPSRDYPYIIPHTWAWVKLENLCLYIQRGKGPKYTENSEYPVVSQKCIQWSGFDLTPARFIKPDSLEKYTEDRFLKKGDLLWNSTGTGTIGRVNIFPGNVRYTKIVADSHVTVVRPKIISSSFLWCYLASPIIQSRIDNLSSGSTKQTELGTGTVKSLAVPLPPIEEQERIVEKVDRLMVLCDELEDKQQSRTTLRKNLNDSALHHLVTAPSPKEQAQRWQCLETNFSDLYSTEENVKSLRATILQLAVQGKLVPQDPNDEPAYKLLEQIAEDKKKLNLERKTKEIGKHKPIPVDDIPFSLPETWEWVHISEISLLVTSGSRGWAKYYSTSGAIFIRMGNLSKDSYQMRLDNLQYVKPPRNGEGSRTKLIENDLLISITGEVGMLGLVPQDFGEAYINQHTGLLRLMPQLRNRFIAEVLKSPLAKQQFNEPQRGIKNSFRLSDIGEMLVPLPPLAEQKRIVKKVDQLMALCDRLEQQIGQSEKLSAALMDSILHHAFAQEEEAQEAA